MSSFADPPPLAAKGSGVLVWFRCDLRMQDHEPLWLAAQSGQAVVPVYCFDPRHWGTTPFGFAKTAAFRSQFLLESVADLRASLQKSGSNLLLRRGDPEQVLPSLVRQLGLSAVYAHALVGTEEASVEANLRLALASQGIPLHLCWGHTLYHPADLPFSLERLPEVFTTFRKQVEGTTAPRPPRPAPPRLPPLPPDLEMGSLPRLADWGLADPVADERAMFRWQGGETAGLARLHHYFWDQDRLRVYKETRNGLLAADDSSKFSAWLALGCLSARSIHEQVQAYEARCIRNNSTYWLVFELLWRDYFHWIALKHGNRLFRPSGLQGLPIPWSIDWPRFERWQAGTTGYPLVDACMQELAATGFISNRGRQNVASFLTKNLGIHWQMGAEWFESLLIDYDVASNWGNWNYTAGIGNDARGFRYFHIPKQSREYDPQGDYLKHWLPALQGIPSAYVHEPYRLTASQQQQYGVRLGVSYPRPVVDLEKSLRAQERIYQTALSQTR
ncbi:MAG: DASH family cryptochrome [Cyanobacteriota bacterium]|nr:DASH family cryptochrome [Cyanobacteriota bacterium]